MRAVACLKVAVDPETVEVDAATGAVRPERLVPMLDAGSAAALELCLRLPGVDVTAVGAGVPAELVVWLRGAVAAGGLDALDVARVLVAACAGADLVLCGARSSDLGSGAVGPALAALIGAAFVGDVDEVDLSPGGPALVRQRRPGGAIARLEVSLPAVVGVHPEAALLREPTLPALLAAREAEIAHLAPPEPTGPSTTAVWSGPTRLRPRPRPAPQADDPWERTWDLVSAALPAREGRTVTGSADTLADALFEHLAALGHLP